MGLEWLLLAHYPRILICFSITNFRGQVIDPNQLKKNEKLGTGSKKITLLVFLSRIWKWTYLDNDRSFWIFFASYRDKIFLPLQLSLFQRWGLFRKLLTSNSRISSLRNDLTFDQITIFFGKLGRFAFDNSLEIVTNLPEVPYIQDDW